MLKPLSFLVALTLSLNGALAQEPKDDLDRAFALLSQGKSTEALTLLADVDRRSGGRSVQALLGMGVVYLRLEQPQEAVDVARRALALDLDARDSTEVSALLGVAIYSRDRDLWMRERPSAIAEAKMRGERVGSALEALVWEPGELAEAASALTRVVDASGAAANKTRLTLVEVLRRMGRWQEALAMLEAYRQAETDAARTATDPLRRCLEWALRQSPPPPGKEVPPKKVKGVEPRYPITPLPHGLSAAAADAFRQWRFEPATYGGVPVPVYYTVTITFSLR